jgi:pyruvate kinase
LIWGVKAFFYDSFESTDKTVEQINKIAKDKGYVNKGDLLVNLTAMPIIDKGMVNTLRVSIV